MEPGFKTRRYKGTMRNRLLAVLFVAAFPLLGACESFLGDDPTPETIRYRIQGPAGTPVQVIISKEFVSGVTETGITQVEIFGSDTLDTTLPVDGELGVSLERRFFVQVLHADSVNIDGARVIVDADGRNLFDESGTLLADPPFRYVYVFNQRTTRVIEVF